MKKTFILLIVAAQIVLFSNKSSARYNPEWKWRTIRTDNFIIYYPEGHETFAKRVLSLGSEVYNDVSGYLGVEPRRCPIVLNPGTDIFNGYYSPFPNRISLFEPPLYSVRGFGPVDDLIDLVYTHEYAHYVHLTTRLGLYGAMCRFLGDGLAVSNIFSPGWIIEGIATNAETMFTDGGRGRCSLFRGKMMSFTELEGLWNLSAAGRYPPYKPPGNRIYLSGYYMIEYLNRVYGEETFPKLGRFQARHPLRGTSRAIKHVINKSPKMFYKEFLADFDARTQNLRDKVLVDGLPSGKVVSSEPIDDYKSHFWTDNGTIKVIRRGYDKKIAIVEINPFTCEIISETKTGNLNNLSTIRSTSDGCLVFGEIFYHPFGDGELDVTDLVVFDPETRKHMRLTKGEHIYSADISPDGRTFAATRRNGMWIDLILLDVDGSNVRSLVSKPGIYVEAPCWSPDGTHIAAIIKVGQKSDIVIINPQTGTFKTLFRSDIHEDNEPSFSPDGRWIVFSSNRSGVWNIYAWDLIEKKLYQLTSVLYTAGEPRVSPDGKILSFFSMYRGVNQLCTIPFKPQAGREIHVEEEGEIEEPNLSRLEPDIGFESKGIPLWEAYKPFVHIPYYGSDEEGNLLGVYFLGADPVGLNTYTAEILYGLESERAGYDISIINKSFWPAIKARVYDSAEKGNTPKGGEDYLTNRGKYFRERGVELSLGLDVIHKTAPGIFQSSYLIGTRFRRFDGLHDIAVNKSRDQSMEIFGELRFMHIPDFAPRDMIPQWAQVLHITHEEGLLWLAGEIPGHNTFISAKQYVPSPLKHHGIEMTLTHQNQRGSLRYEKRMSIPRGYSSDDTEGDIYLRKNLMMSLEYHFPLWYTDRGVGLILYHINLLKGSFFIDYGAGWDGNFDISSWADKARMSVGGTLTTKSTVMSWLPIEFGISAGYKIRDREEFANFILSIDIDDFNIRPVYFDYFQSLYRTFY